MSECYDLLKLYELGLEGKRQRSVKRRKGFELLWLPVLAKNEVVRSMDIHEIIKLSLCSRKMEGAIRYAKVKVNKIAIHVKSILILQIESINKNCYYCSPDYQEEGTKTLGPLMLSRWINENSSSFQNCVSIFKHLQNIFLFESLCLYVNFEHTTVQFFKEILTEPSLKDFEFLRLDRGEIDTECLDLVMETAHSNRDLHILETKVPENYYHENALKFYDITYNDAKWVRIEHLFTLKDSSSLKLGRHNLTGFDVNTFIKFWIENDHDMVQSLKLGTDVSFQTDILFDGIVVLQGRRSDLKFHLVAANPTKQRKYQVLLVAMFSSTIHLYSWVKDEPVLLEENEYVDSLEREYEVLMILNKKKELEEEWKKIQNLLETNQDQNIVEKKDDISRQLQVVSVELDNYNLVFRDGFYSYV